MPPVAHECIVLNGSDEIGSIGAGPSPKSICSAPQGFAPVTVIVAGWLLPTGDGDTVTLARLTTLITTGADTALMFEALNAFAVSVYVPVPTPLHVKLYGAAVSVARSVVPA